MEMNEVSKPQLEYFKIEGLHGRQDVSFSMSGRIGVFIADNGSGKTTALFILQSILKNEFSKLSKFKYERIHIKFTDSDIFTFSPKDYDHSRKMLFFRNLLRNSTMSHKQISRLITMAKKNPVGSLREDPIFAHAARLSRMPPGIFASRLRSIDVEPDGELDLVVLSEDSSVTKLRAFLKSQFNHSVIYLPTYRRVEQDLEELVDSAEEEGSFTALDIHFGMKDVEDRLSKSTKQIRDHFVESYGQVSGQMLGQLADNTPVSEQMKRRLSDRSSIELVLGRVADYVSDTQRTLILKLFDEDRLLENGHLSFFLSSLIESYEQVREVDTALQRYAQVCNSYLSNKEMRYDGLNAIVSVYETIGGSKLDLATLSSGEKQILGVMSELYLGDKSSYIVIFDEPELSLSMDWQKKILVDVAASEKTFCLIAATHSPFVFENELDGYARSLEVKFRAPLAGEKHDVA
ncbi:AAA family ATPase [Methylobacterium goesingense]|uniref:ATP-binding protein involved in virulence n=1 Tax=Methylobacterium goesingense TaxID=243690 RepID=A0ABV2LCQ2_9HYPH|nr:AAA family ATPase [Methylobacterium goesingense]GJD76587.1 hypothetical protein CFIICLFH_4845 [Methylobacterium goesingense]